MATTKNKAQSNGNADILTDAQHRMRAQVVDLELKARYWEAEYKIKHFTLECNKMNDAYAAHVEAEQKKADEAYKRFMKQVEESGGMITTEVGPGDPTEQPEEEKPEPVKA